MLREAPFGSLPDGREVRYFLLENERGIEVELLEYGGILHRVRLPDRNGKLQNVILGLRDLEAYRKAQTNFGGIIGRFANRIDYGNFEIGGRSYSLACNLGDLHLHGGISGFDRKLWRGESFLEHGKRGVTLTYISPDGEEGYPGTLDCSVVITLTDTDELSFVFTARTDRPTHVNLSHHPYWNLSGDFDKTVLHHRLRIFAEKYTATDARLVPTGELASVAETPLDFRASKPVGSRLKADFEPLRRASGYDHNYVLRESTGENMVTAAELLEPVSGRKMTLRTTLPGLQFYSAQWLDDTHNDPEGNPMRPHRALCLEPQFFPDTPHHAHFPPTLLQAGDTYRHEIRYQFEG